jgi:flavin-dependent dehydrogenase
VPSPRCQVAIVGGGPAGLAAAIALAQAGISSHVVERTDYDAPRVGEHLAPGVKPLFESLGISGLLNDEAHLPCPGVRSVWGSSEVIDKDYLFHPNGQGVNLSRPEFDKALADCAARAGVAVATGGKVLHLSRSRRDWVLTYARRDDQYVVTADFIIDATGRAASIAKRLGARPLIFDDLIGVAAPLTTMSEDRRVYIEALECGWWYSAKLTSDKLITVFMTDSDLLGLAAERAQVWDAMVAKSPLTRARLDPRSRPDHLQVRTARSQCLDKMHGDAWLAVGDAAMSYDPLSSEGISKGIEWGRKAAQATAAWIKGDRSAGSRYAEEATRTFSAYLHQRHVYYAAEKRWAGSPFWQRRQSIPSPRGARKTSRLHGDTPRAGWR